MIDDTDTDYCDRLPGQHTGRLSLELQASEAAEWQRSIAELEVMLVAAADTIRRLTSPASPAAGESPGISPEPAQAHGLSEHQLRAIGEAVTALRFCASQNDWYTEARATELRNIANALTGIEIDAAATPSAAVGASGPVAECSLCNGDGGRPDPTFVRWHRCVRCEGTGKEPSDSKPTNTHNPESEDTPPRGNDAPATGKPFQLEHSKQYLRRDGKVSGVMTQTKGGEYSVSHPLWDDFHCLSYRPDGRYNVSEAEDKFDLISEYHEPEPIPPAESEVDRLQRELDAAVEYHDNYTSKIDKALGQPRHGGDLLTEHLREIERLTYLPQTASPPAESPDDWVTQDRVPSRRGIDRCWFALSGNEPSDNMALWWDCDCDDNAVGKMHGDASDNPGWVLNFRCLRKDLPVLEVVSPASCSPVCALCGNIATCFGQYADHDKGFACDSCCGHGNEDGWCMTIGEYDRQNSALPAVPPPLPSPWRPMSEKPPTDSWVWLAWTSSKHVSVYRHENIWLAPSYAIAWMPATPPTHPKAPPVVPKTRTITLREYSLFEGTSSAVRSWTEIIPGLPWKDTCRTCECEVPE